MPGTGCANLADMKNILTPRVLIAMLITAAVFLCATLIIILVMRPAASPPSLTPVSAALTILPADTSTPRTLPPTFTPFPPTPLPTFTPAPGEVAVGVYVQPATSGEGLHVRAGPSLNADIAFTAFDSEVFLVTDGPTRADGYTWWYLTASYDAVRSGWAVQDFLAVLPSSP